VNCIFFIPKTVRNFIFIKKNILEFSMFIKVPRNVQITFISSGRILEMNEKVW
jgi:hypothetical protein